jgi:RNA polymerase sigma-70 factor (ECF subfamily)
MSRNTAAGHIPGDASDAHIVAAVRRGDREAFRILVVRYQDVLYRYALRMTGQADVAADLAQAAFVKAYGNLSRCRDPERFGAWLFRILVNGCKDYLKSHRRRDASLDHRPVASAASENDPAAEVERSELRTLLDEALARLPEPQRQAFVLKHVEGLSYEEIAELLGVSIPALKMRVHRAREALRAVLEEVL